MPAVTHGPVGDAVDAIADLGRQHELCAAVGEVAADARFGQAVAARGVDQGDAQIERRVEQACDCRLVLLGIADLAGAEAEGGGGKAGAANQVVMHGGSVSGG